MPTATLDLTGMASYELFLRGTLDKIGAYPDTLHIGEYKTASNTFTEHTFTPAHREMAESLNADLYEQLDRAGSPTAGRSRRRRSATSSTTARSCRRTPFAPGSSTTWRTRTSSTTRSSSSKGIRRLHDRDGVPARDRLPSLGLNRGPRIAVIYATGIIASGESNYDSPAGRSSGSDTIVEYLRKARADSSSRRSCCASTARADPRSRPT